MSGAPVAVTSPVDLPRASILIVDDHPANRLVARALLESLDVALVEASSGDEALRLARAQDFALVLMDVHMPDMDGFETVRRLRNDDRTKLLPVVFLTAGDTRDVARAWALDAVDYMAKPLDGEMLKAKVRTFAALYLRGQQVKLQADALRRTHDAMLAAHAERHAAEGVAAAAVISQREAEAIGRLRETFISVLAHDLRGPLSAITLGSQRILSDEGASEHSRAIAARIARSGDRMSGLITDVLDFARGHLGAGIPIAPLETNMAHVCASVVDEVQMQFPQREIVTTCRGDLRGQWDRARVEQALANLLTNALQHGEGNVGLTAIAQGDRVVVEVHNGGPPIPPAQIKTMFDPFRTVGESRGLGLGLYIVREVVRAHGARIDVGSDAETGTRFTISWPRNVSAVETERDPAVIAGPNNPSDAN